MELIIAVAVFVTTLVIIMSVGGYIKAKRQRINERLERYVVQRSSFSETISPPMAAGSREVNTWRAVLRWLSRYLEAPHWSRSLEHRLIQAGVPLRGSEFVVICLLLATGGFMVVFILDRGRLSLAVLSGLCGCLLPLMWLRLRVQRRMKAFNSQLGDALILIANALRTGYSFLQAIEMVSREMLAPIAIEFGRLLKEMNLGVTTEDALNNLAKRVDSDDLELVITAVLIQRQVGGNLAEVLDNIAGTIRERVKIKGEIKTLTAQGRMSGLIIGMLPVVLTIVIYIVNPSYIELLFTHPAGKLMLAGAVVSQILGVLFIRRIVNIEV